MLVFRIVLLVLVILCAVWLLLIMGRARHPGRAKMTGQLFAHRGFHSEPEAPENSREAFRRAAARGFGAEFDVHLLKDGGLAVMHDSALKRMTGCEGEIENLTVEQLKDYTLGRSSETIPTFADVLQIFDGKTPLIIELKTRGRNAAPLCEAVCRVLDTYKGTYCLESFDPRVVEWLRKNRPDILRGQLSQNFVKERSGLSLPLAIMGTWLLCNFFTRPDFIAYKFEDRHNLSNQACLHIWHTAGASWTIRSKEDMKTAKREGLWPIFENFDPAEE